jgi:hypothetical protein
VTRKTVSFSVPAKARSSSEGVGAGRERRASDVPIEAHSDDWVSDRRGRGGEAAAHPATPSLMLDLAAERGLTEVFALSVLAPFALGFFWLVNAIAGRVRF